jgi:hypothetical protein
MSRLAIRGKGDGMNECEHNWTVVSASVELRVIGATRRCKILVGCDDCCTLGIVEDFTDEEWEKAFVAASEPYPWADASRVIVCRKIGGHWQKAA